MPTVWEDTEGTGRSLRLGREGDRGSQGLRAAPQCERGWAMPTRELEGSRTGPTPSTKEEVTGRGRGPPTGRTTLSGTQSQSQENRGQLSTVNEEQTVKFRQTEVSRGRGVGRGGAKAAGRGGG